MTRFNFFYLTFHGRLKKHFSVFRSIIFSFNTEMIFSAFRISKKGRATTSIKANKALFLLKLCSSACAQIRFLTCARTKNSAHYKSF